MDIVLTESQSDSLYGEIQFFNGTAGPQVLDPNSTMYQTQKQLYSHTQHSKFPDSRDLQKLTVSSGATVLVSQRKSEIFVSQEDQNDLKNLLREIMGISHISDYEINDISFRFEFFDQYAQERNEFRLNYLTLTPTTENPETRRRKIATPSFEKQHHELGYSLDIHTPPDVETPKITMDLLFVEDSTKLRKLGAMLNKWFPEPSISMNEKIKSRTVKFDFNSTTINTTLTTAYSFL
jgi:hypothetical protein